MSPNYYPLVKWKSQHSTGALSCWGVARQTLNIIEGGLGKWQEMTANARTLWRGFCRSLYMGAFAASSCVSVWRHHTRSPRRSRPGIGAPVVSSTTFEWVTLCFCGHLCGDSKALYTGCKVLKCFAVARVACSQQSSCVFGATSVRATLHEAHVISRKSKSVPTPFGAMMLDSMATSVP